MQNYLILTDQQKNIWNTAIGQSVGNGRHDCLQQRLMVISQYDCKTIPFCNASILYLHFTTTPTNYIIDSVSKVVRHGERRIHHFFAITCEWVSDWLCGITLSIIGW